GSARARAVRGRAPGHRGHDAHGCGGGSSCRDPARIGAGGVGAGTLLRAADVATAVQAGAGFLVSPGLTPELAAAALAAELPYLPGVATPSEVMAARALGLCVMKFFPAEALGGAAWLRALAPVFPGVAFCPTGGIDETRAAEYLTLANVPMVGGSWMVPRDAVAAGDWRRIRRLAARAAGIGRGA